MQFKLEKLLEASKRWSDPELRRAMAALELADRRLKGGGETSTTLLTTLVASCRGDSATSPRRGR
jgi:DNA polymerase III delta subunit